MYVFSYSIDPLPRCLTIPFMSEVTNYSDLVDYTQENVFGCAFKQLLCDEYELTQKYQDDIIKIIVDSIAENAIEAKLLITMQFLLYCLEIARKRESMEDLENCIEGFNEIFAPGNPTGWSFGAKLVMDDTELADFLAGDMGHYERVRGAAQKVFDSHHF